MLKIIEGQPVSGFIDHDYGKIINFSARGKIEWFKYRFNKNLFNPIEAIDKIIEKAKKEGKHCLLENDETSVRTIIVQTTCVGIDLLAGFLSGRTNDKEKGVIQKDFKSFVDCYMDHKGEYTLNPFGSFPKYSDFLYQLFRCGLAHNLTIKKVGFGYGDKYFKTGEDGNYYVSANKLYEDLKQALIAYTAHVKENKNGLCDKFNLRFAHIFVNRQ